MVPTVAQVFTGSRYELDEDDPGIIFTDAALTPGFGNAFEIIFNELHKNQLPRTKVIATYTLPAGTSVLTPETAGITNLGELVEIEEQTAGAGDQYQTMRSTEKLSQRPQYGELIEYVWRLDAIYFIGSTAGRDLRITYYGSGSPPASGPVGIDGSLPYFRCATAAFAGRRKGHEWKGLYVEAFGEQYERGVLGGHLFHLIQPMVRQMQQIEPPIQSARYSAGSRRRRILLPYVIGQAGGSEDGMHLRRSSVDSTITGAIDGSNDTFVITGGFAALRSHRIFLNGISLEENLGYTISGVTITFATGYIPHTGDTVAADIWV